MSNMSNYLRSGSCNLAARSTGGYGVCELHSGMGSRMFSFHTLLSMVSHFILHFSSTVRHNLIVSSLKRHRTVIEERHIPYLRRFDFENENDYPYRSHGQPFTAVASLAGCLFILIVADGAALWIKFRPQPFLSAYLSVRDSPDPSKEM